MDPLSLKNTAALLSHVDKLTGTLVTRFLNITALAKVEKMTLSQTDNYSTQEVNRTQAATNTFRMQVEAAALTRAAEDILSVTRKMKEMWLFGELNTLGESKVEQPAEEDAKVAAGLISRILDKRKEIIDLDSKT